MRSLKRDFKGALLNKINQNKDAVIAEIKKAMNISNRIRLEKSEAWPGKWLGKDIVLVRTGCRIRARIVIQSGYIARFYHMGRIDWNNSFCCSIHLTKNLDF